MHRLGAQYEGSSNQVDCSEFNCGGYMNSRSDARALLCGPVPPGASYDPHLRLTLLHGAYEERVNNYPSNSWGRGDMANLLDRYLRSGLPL
jgi:hypothetical protein